LYIYSVLYTALYIYSVLYTALYIYSVLYTALYIYSVLYTALYIYSVLYTTLYIYSVLYTTLYIYSVLSLIRMKVRNSDILAESSRDDRAMKKYSTCTVQYHVQFQEMTEQWRSCFSIKELHKQ